MNTGGIPYHTEISGVPSPESAPGGSRSGVNHESEPGTMSAFNAPIADGPDVVSWVSAAGEVLPVSASRSAGCVRKRFDMPLQVLGEDVCIQENLWTFKGF